VAGLHFFLVTCRFLILYVIDFKQGDIHFESERNKFEAIFIGTVSSSEYIEIRHQTGVLTSPPAI
jgi:hypothetical protein